MINKTADTQLVQILSYFQCEEVIEKGRVCKHWNHLTSNDFIWRVLFSNTFPLYQLPPNTPLKAHFRAQILALQAQVLPKPLSLNVGYMLTTQQVMKHYIRTNGTFTSDIAYNVGTIFFTDFYGNDRWHVRRYLCSDLPPLDQEVIWPNHKVIGLFIKTDGTGTSSRQDLKDYKFEFSSHPEWNEYKIKMVKRETIPEAVKSKQ